MSTEFQISFKNFENTIFDDCDILSPNLECIIFNTEFQNFTRDKNGLKNQIHFQNDLPSKLMQTHQIITKSRSTFTVGEVYSSWAPIHTVTFSPSVHVVFQAACVINSRLVVFMDYM